MKTSSLILIVDDEPDICFLLSNILKQKKFETIIAGTLTDGLKKLKQFSPSILFLDIQLPDGSGLNAIRPIRKELPGIKIIMMSAYDGIAERKKATEEGANFFIGKPFNTISISESLEKVNGQ